MADAQSHASIRAEFLKTLARARVDSSEPIITPPTEAERLELLEVEQEIDEAIEQILPFVQDKNDSYALQDAISNAITAFAKRHAILLGMAERRKNELGDRQLAEYSRRLEIGYKNDIVRLLAAIAEALF